MSLSSRRSISLFPVHRHSDWSSLCSVCLWWCCRVSCPPKPVNQWALFWKLSEAFLPPSAPNISLWTADCQFWRLHKKMAFCLVLRHAMAYSIVLYQMGQNCYPKCVCVCTCVCFMYVCVHMCMHTYTFMHIPKVNLGCCSSGTVTLLCESGSCIELKTHPHVWLAG